MTRIPRLLDKDLREVRPLRPLTYSLTTQLTPLSTAKLSVPAAASELSVRDFVELYSPRGSEGIYQVKSLSTDVSITEAVLQHGLCSLADYMHPGEAEQTGSLRTLLTALLANQTRWVLGDCEAPEDQDLTWKINNSNDLQSLTDILAELPGYRVVTDQRTLPWVMHIRALPSEVGCECRLERNLTDIQIDYDASDMCTRAYVDGLDAPMDADTIGEWGEIARHVSIDEDLGEDVIRQTVTRYLEKNKNPRATVTLTAVELSRLTGEPFDAFEVGQLCRCILPDMTAVLRIVTIQRPDPIGSPEHAVLTLAAVLDDLSITIAGVVVDTRHVNQLYHKLEKNLRVEAETIEMLAREIALKAAQLSVDELSGRVTLAETAIEQTAKDLTLYVKKDDDISSMIELSGDGVSISGGVITLTGYVKADELEANYIKAENLSASLASLDAINLSGSLSANGVQAQYGDFTNISIQNTACHKSTLTIGDKTCTFFAPSDATFELSDMPGYDDALAAARTEGASSATPTEVSRVATYDSAANAYEVSVVVISADGTRTTFGLVDIDATEAYDAGYAAGYQAAKAATKVIGAITSIKNDAPNRMLASGWAKAMVGEEQMDYTAFSKAQTFSWMGQG